jgi:hypothetical protein
MTDDALDRYARDLAADIEDSIQTGTDTVYSEEEFTRIVLDELSDEGALDNPILLYQEGTFGRTSYKITGYSIPESEDRVLLITTIYTGEVPPRNLTGDELKTAVMRAVAFYRCSCEGLYKKIEPSNTEASDLARRIYEIHDRVDVLRIVLLSDGMAGLKSLDVRDTKDGTRVLVDMFGIERLHRILGEGLTRDDIVLDFSDQTGRALPCLKASRDTGDYDAYLTAIPGSVLAGIYEKYGTHLLELNVRAFLGVRGRKTVNAGLRRTIKEEPGRFLAYNNGIVATADEIEVDEYADGMAAIKNLRGLQIVNGGQTTASLYRARKQDKISLDAIMVPAKIIRVRRDELDSMVSAVSRSANSQNTVQPADFSANDPFHVTVEALSNNTWLPDHKGRWFYERARGSYGAAELRASFRTAEKRRFASETPKARRFSKTDLAKFLNAWDGLPHVVALGNQKNFQYFMQALKEQYPNGYTPDEAWYRAFIAKAILYRAVESIVKARKFPAYRANITTYTVAAISWKSGGRIDFDRIWSNQALSPELESMIDNWVPEIEQELRRSAGSRMPSEWAKKAECRDAIRDLALELPEPLPIEMQVQLAGSPASGRKASSRNEGLTRDDLDLIEMCRQIDSSTWLKVAEWGTRSKAIHWKVAGIARTVAEYAIGGWERSPSAKQAKWAMEAYKAAENEGALSRTPSADETEVALNRES